MSQTPQAQATAPLKTIKSLLPTTGTNSQKFASSGKKHDGSQTSFYTLIKGVDTTSGAFSGVVIMVWWINPTACCTPVRYTFTNKRSKRRTLGNHDAIEEPVNIFSEQFLKWFFSYCEEHFKNLQTIFHYKEPFVEWKVVHGTVYANIELLFLRVYIFKTLQWLSVQAFMECSKFLNKYEINRWALRRARHLKHSPASLHKSI